MDILKKFYEFFSDLNNDGHNFKMFKYTDLIYVGIDQEGTTTVLCKSTKPARSSIRQKTKKLSIESNVRVQFEADGIQEVTVAHIIKCYCNSTKERDIFLELCPLFEDASVKEDQEDALLETVTILTSFFANSIEPSDIELQGLYAELYTIWAYRMVANLGKYWQSRQRMTFDFSLTDDIKIEVKSTTKNVRNHHFRHEQLMEDPYTVYIVSYLMRRDDEGLSLFDLINMVKPLLCHDSRKILAIDLIVKNTTEDRLKEFRFNEGFMSQRKRVYRAADVPKFKEHTPDGVSNTEYDCNLDSAVSLEEAVFETEIKSITNKG